MIKAIHDKEGAEVRGIEDQMDVYDSTIYTCYYWMYILGFALFITFNVLTVNRLQQLPRELYY
jgi:hypothetical protein